MGFPHERNNESISHVHYNLPSLLSTLSYQDHCSFSKNSFTVIIFALCYKNISTCILINSAIGAIPTIAGCPGIENYLSPTVKYFEKIKLLNARDNWF